MTRRKESNLNPEQLQDEVHHSRPKFQQKFQFFAIDTTDHAHFVGPTHTRTQQIKKKKKQNLKLSSETNRIKDASI